LNAARKKHITSLPTNPKRKNVHSAFTLNTNIICGTKEKKKNPLKVPGNSSPKEAGGNQLV